MSYRKYIYPLLVLVMLSSLSCFAANNFSDDDLYGPIPKDLYLSGRFAPEQHPNFVNLRKYQIPTDGREHYLHYKTAIALQKMIAAFQKDHPSIKIYITSSTRNFQRQQQIWESKWLGQRLVNGLNLATQVSDPAKRGLIILQYSSMPGTSRHHWGSDFDINILENDYYQSGNGKTIYNWLKLHAQEYGFAQPYTADRSKGYAEEKWHWSYLPLAKEYLSQWENLSTQNPKFFWKNSNFAGAQDVYKLAIIYVTEISKECK